MAHQYDTIIIGAGLSGLIAARTVARAGRQVLVLEKESVVGGRQQTREVDGFLLDRGFQLLNPAYPSVKRHVDLAALDLRPFGSGVMVRTDDGLDLLAHPARHPQRLPRTLASRLVGPTEPAALAAWLGRAADADAPIGEAWVAAGVTGPLREQVLEPFLAGVIAEDQMETSATYVRFLFRMFATGRPSLPSRGIRALPAQLAAAARREGADIRLESSVDSFDTDGDIVTVEAGGETLSCRTLIVAVGPDAVSTLTGDEQRTTRGLTTWWFAADDAPTAEKFIAIDGTRSGPILNTAVVTNVAPSYSPDGTPLVQASALLGDKPVSDSEAREHTAAIWGTDAGGLTLLARDDIRHALPAFPPGAPTRHSSGSRVFFAGDQEESPSIEGALSAGLRAAADSLR